LEKTSGLAFTAVLQFLWSLWIEQWIVYFHPSKQQSLAGAPEGKTPLDRIGSALHQLENRYNKNGNRGRNLSKNRPCTPGIAGACARRPPIDPPANFPYTKRLRGMRLELPFNPHHFP
jgi:hypothetical protein